MFPPPVIFQQATPCFPRVRGDVPTFRQVSMLILPFSPRARGCSEDAELRADWEAVFPACAGMFLAARTFRFNSCRFPRVRGDVPVSRSPNSRRTPFSPRARGCSFTPSSLVTSTSVFPACAGMFRPTRTFGCAAGRFPRVRGDVPCRISYRAGLGQFSPRARGCSVMEHAHKMGLKVFPACAGMFHTFSSPFGCP